VCKALEPKNKEKLRNHPKPLGWLITTAKRYYINELLKLLATLPLPPDLPQESDRRRPLLHEALDELWRLLLYEALDDLPNWEREVLELRYFGGLNDRQIGEILFETGTPESRTQRAFWLRHKALNDLQKILENKGLGPDYDQGLGPDYDR
jgi:DNA-directed RNA polymerase specialized sigma24 family protein